MHSYAVRVTIFSTGGKFRPVSNFTGLHNLIQAACSYVFLVCDQLIAFRLSAHTLCLCVNLDKLSDCRRHPGFL